MFQFLCKLQAAFFLLSSSARLAALYYAPRPLIDGGPGNDATSYTTHTRVSGHKKINICSSNPWESNHRDGHKKDYYFVVARDFAN